MANKPKKKIKSNLLKIREELDLTQEELGKILNVSTRQICNYESDDCSTLPLDKALILSQKYNYSLDWIYCNSLSTPKKYLSYPEQEKDNFLIDMRNFICTEENGGNSVLKKKYISFIIPDCYWQYMSEKNKILSSHIAKQKKSHDLAELNSKYSVVNSSTLCWKYSIPYDDFMSHLHLGDAFCPYIPNDKNISTMDILPEQITEAEEFIKLVVDTSSQMEE